MEIDENKILDIGDRQSFRSWLVENHDTETECWISVKRGKPTDDDHFWYLDAVEEALCFGWIDSTTKKVDGISYQRFSPRRNAALWTELNKERCRRLERLGLMTDAGRAVMPDLDEPYRIPDDLERRLKENGVWTRFIAFPPLYQRVRAYNVDFYRTRYPDKYEDKVEQLIAKTLENKMYGNWNDYGRLPTS